MLKIEVPLAWLFLLSFFGIAFQLRPLSWEGIGSLGWEKITTLGRQAKVKDSLKKTQRRRFKFLITLIYLSVVGNIGRWFTI